MNLFPFKNLFQKKKIPFPSRGDFHEPMPKLFPWPNSLKPKTGPIDRVISRSAWEQAGSFSSLPLWLHRRGESLARGAAPQGG